MKKTLLSINTMLLILFSILTLAVKPARSAPQVNLRPGTSSDRIEKTYDVNPNGRLTVTSDIGTVDVQTAARDRVTVIVTKKAKRQLNRQVQEALADFKVTFDSSHSGVSIRGEFQRGRNYWRYWKRQLNQLDIRFLVTVPRRYNVDLNTHLGNISTDDLIGEVQAQTSAGNIYIDDVIGPVQTQTSGGTLRFNGVKGPISGRSTAGEITLANCQGMVDIKTSVGNIEAELTTQPQHQWTLQNSVGDITVTLNSNIAVEIDARTARYVGILSTDLIVRGNKTSSRLRGTINGGGPLLKFRTSIGEIRLLRN